VRGSKRSGWRLRFAHSLLRSLFTVLSAVFVDFLLLGVVLATCGWRVCSLCCARTPSDESSLEQAALEQILADAQPPEPLG
jgi:hypothetical protein